MDVANKFRERGALMKENCYIAATSLLVNIS